LQKWQRNGYHGAAPEEWRDACIWGINLKRLLASALVIIFLAGLPGLTFVALADDSHPCNALTFDHPHSDTCNADVAANPLPDLVRPTQPDPKMDGYSKPWSILLPKDPLPYKVGWMIHDWYYSDVPGVQPPALSTDRLVHKAQLVYVYATVKTSAGLPWVMVGPDRWMPGEYVAVLTMPHRPDGVSGPWIALDLSQQTIIALDGDTPIFATLVSAAWGGFGVTREGLFHIYGRTIDMTFRGPPWAKVPEYIIPHVPYVMFFDQNIGLHGAYWHNYFGYERTHGCVNIPVADEKWLWNWVSGMSDKWGPDDGSFFMKHPENAPWVFVYKSTKPNETAMVSATSPLPPNY